MSGDNRLTVRQYERQPISLPVEFVIAEEHCDQVRYGSQSEAAERHGVAGKTLDVSPGGIGMSLRQFVPRMCEGWVRLLHPTATTRTVLIEHRAKVRRVQMCDHAPTYFVGVAFIDADPELQQSVKSLIATLASETAGGGDA